MPDYKAPKGQIVVALSEDGKRVVAEGTLVCTRHETIIDTRENVDAEIASRGLVDERAVVAEPLDAPQDALHDRKALLALTDSELGKRVREAWTAPVDEPVDVTRRGE